MGKDTTVLSSIYGNVIKLKNVWKSGEIETHTRFCRIIYQRIGLVIELTIKDTNYVKPLVRTQDIVDNYACMGSKICG